MTEEGYEKLGSWILPLPYLGHSISVAHLSFVSGQYCFGPDNGGRNAQSFALYARPGKDALALIS